MCILAATDERDNHLRLAVARLDSACAVEAAILTGDPTWPATDLDLRWAIARLHERVLVDLHHAMAVAA